MTLTEFRATGRNVADLAMIPECAMQEIHGPGRVYAHGLCIQGRAGDWYLTIGNDSHSGSLETLESELFAFAQSEGYVS